MSNYINKQSKYEIFQSEREKLKFRLEQLKRNLKFGYSDSNFSTIAYDFGKLSPHMSLKSMNALAELWSLSYTEDLDPTLVDDTVNSILFDEF